MREYKGKQISDIEIDRRIFNGHIIVLLEDHHRNMLNSDGTSRQYIISVEGKSKKTGDTYLTQKRFISNLMKRRGFMDAKDAAKTIFFNLENYKSILGEHWLPFSEVGSNT